MSERVILIVESNPKNTSRLRLDAEIKAIRNALRSADQTQQFKLEIEHAAQINDLADALVRYKPEIVHFMGHGEGETGLCFEGSDGKKQLLDNQAIENIFELSNAHVKCVCLNACYSEVQANVMAQHIDHVIGMSDKIPDTTATAFSAQFYRYIGLEEAVPSAFKWAKTILAAHNLPDHLVPVLKIKGDHSHLTAPSNINPKPIPNPEPAPLVPNTPLLVIPSSIDHGILADKHYVEVQNHLDAYWGINGRRIGRISSLKRELNMEQPNVIYMYAKAQHNSIILDNDYAEGDTLDLAALAQWLQQEGLKPLLILALFGETLTLPDSLKQQCRFIWQLNANHSRQLAQLSHMTCQMIERTLQQPNIITLIAQLEANLKKRSIASQTETSQTSLKLAVDAQSQRQAQQFRAALLRIMLGREELKKYVGISIQQHLGKPDLLIYAITGTELSCVSELPEQVRYLMQPDPKTQQGVTLINHPLHLNLRSKQSESDSEHYIFDAFEQSIKHGSDQLERLIDEMAQQRGITANSGAIVFYWDVRVAADFSAEDLKNWLTIWRDIIADEFYGLPNENATLVQALCIQAQTSDQVEALHKQTQAFLRGNVQASNTQKPLKIKHPLGTLDPEEIDDFFAEDDNQEWVRHFKFSDYNINSYQLAEWVVEKTGGEFENVVSLLWKTQQDNYQDYLRDANHD